MKKSELRKLIREIISEQYGPDGDQPYPDDYTPGLGYNVANFPTTDIANPQFTYMPNGSRYKVICPEGYKFRPIPMQGMAGAQNKSQLFNRDGSNPPFTAYDELHIGVCQNNLELPRPETSPKPETSPVVKPDPSEPVRPKRER